jgi:flagellar biosynthesis regulator FlaF
VAQKKDQAEYYSKQIERAFFILETWILIASHPTTDEDRANSELRKKIYARNDKRVHL